MSQTFTNTGDKMGIGIATGVVIGVVLGLLFNNIGFGLRERVKSSSRNHPSQRLIHLEGLSN